MTNTIREAAPGDQSDVASLLESNGLPVLELDGKVDAFVAEIGGTFAGCVALEVHGGVGLLRSLAVSEPARGRGTAARLVEAVVQRARERALPKVVLLTLDAQGYFEKHGFTTTSRCELEGPILDSWEFRHHGCDDAVVMVRTLS